MNKILQFLLMYLIIVGVFFSFSYSTITNQENRLSLVESQLHGVNYLKSIFSLSMSVAHYMEISLNIGYEQASSTKKDILDKINKIYKLQEQNKEYKNEDLNTQLELIKTFKMSENEFYKFLNSINHENYIIGDKSKLLFEEDRELHFLGSLTTHYMPEYLISILIGHNIIEEINNKNSISDEKKNIFIEQNKLMYLSSEEISGIIKLLSKYKNTKKLQTYILNIEKELENLKKITTKIYTWKVNKGELKKYINLSHKLLGLSYQLNDEHFYIIESVLKNKRDNLINDIFKKKILCLLIIISISFLMYFLYKFYISNVKKDSEIRKMNKTLDQFVIFSRTDINGVITYASSALEELSGFSHNELIGKTHRLFKHEDMEQSNYTDLWNTILSKKIWSGNILNKAKDGTAYWTKTTIVPDLNKNNEIINFSAYAIDITDHKALEIEKIKTQKRRDELLITNGKLEKLSIIDTLTQVYNRLKLDMVTQSHYESYKRYKKVFSIILIDVDYFKNVNDTYGHLVGDKVLIDIANIIKNNIRSVDTIGRWGGEEFMVICQETDCNNAYKLAEKIRKNIENYNFDTIGKKTISLGISEIEENLFIDDVIKRADDALFIAKNSGRNKSVKYTK